jgi:hypothetical protein
LKRSDRYAENKNGTRMLPCATLDKIEPLCGHKKEESGDKPLLIPKHLSLRIDFLCRTLSNVFSK